MKMIRKVSGLVVALTFVAFVSQAQENSLGNYFSNDQVSISSSKMECHYPENGIHSEYVFVKIVNHTSQEIVVDYKLDTWYNYGKSTPDISNYTIKVPANGTIEGTCADRKAGLSIYSKILDLPAKSVLAKFELNELKLNGEPAK